MSEDSAEVDSSVLETVQLAIRRNVELAFVKNAKIEFKGDRSEPRILALSAHRFYVLTCSKNGCKVDFSMHILEIQRMESSKPLLLTLSCGEKSYYFRVAQPKDTTEIIAHIVASLKSNFPSGSPDRLLRVVYGPPEESDERQAQVTTLVNNLRNMEGDVETGPCGGFSKVYVSMCDFYGQPHLEEVVWDIDTIYLSLNTKELNIQDFDHLDQKDLVPIISTLEYNDWFTKISCDSFKLGSEVCDAILRVIKKSSTVEELTLDNVSFGRDYCQKLALALTSNPKTSLHSLSLSGDSIEDRGVVHLAGIFSKLPHGLVSLSLADSGITSKGATSLGQALKSNKYNESSLQRLDLSKNPFKADGVAGLCDFFAKPNMLTFLDLSATECPLDLLFGALIRGCVQQLASIRLAGNSFTTKKTKDAVVPPSFQQFFSSSQALKFLDVSDCKLHAEAVGAIFKGLTENNVLCGVELNISKNELRASGARAIAESIGKLKTVSRLDISDNGFEMGLLKILEQATHNKSIEYLNLGQNTKHSKSSAAVMEALVQLISGENSHLESISLADSKLKDDIIPFLDALGTNESLKELDISGNQMGDEGARILAKALQINSKLRTLTWDKNGTTYRGFADIAAALECNHTLLSMPMPLYDAAQSLKPQTEQHLRKIEKLLLRNQSPHKVVTDQAYRLQQGLFLASTQQQMVDRLVVQLQDLMSDLRLSKDTDVKNEIKTAKHYIQDADKLKQLLLKFHLCTNDSDLEARFAELATDFHKAAEDKMKSNLDKMIDCAKEVCPYITSTDDMTSRLEAVVQNKPQLSETFVEELVLTQAAAGIANRLSEDKLTVASVMVDTIMDMVIHQLESSVNKLDLLLRDHRNRMEEVEKEAEKIADEDDVAAVARKARNRLSSSQLAVPVTDGTDAGVRNYKRRPTVSRRPTHAKVMEEEDEKEKEDKEGIEPVKEVVDGKPPAPQLKTDFTAEEPKASALKHLGKDRPRPPQKRRPPTRPSNRPSVSNGATPDDEEQQEDVEVFWKKTVDVPPVEVTPPSKKTSTSKAPPATTQTTAASKTPPPKPPTKPKPAPKTKETEENKKSGWMPKGGINIGIPGFLKKKNRDRSSTAPDTTEASTAWYTNNSEKTRDEKKAKAESLKESRNRAASETKPEVRIERTQSDKKSDVTKERAASEKKPEVSKERVPSVKKPEVTKEKTPPTKKPEVPAGKVPTEKKPEEPSTEDKKEVKPTEDKSEISRDRKPSDRKPDVARPPIMGMKPFSLPRNRATTDSVTRATASQPRDRAATSGQTTKPTPEEPAPAPASATARKPPKFGIGIGGAAGGGLLAEMKMRQERAASLGRPEKPVDTKPAEESSKEIESEVTKERLVKPSSFKRPRLPSGTPPKPAPRPPRKEPREEKKEEKKEERLEIKTEEKPEENKDKQPKESKVDNHEEKKPKEKQAEKPIENKEEGREEKKSEEKQAEKPIENKEEGREEKEVEKPEEKKSETPEEKKEAKKEEDKVDEEDGKEAGKAKEEETEPKIGVGENEKGSGAKVNQEAKELEQEKPEVKSAEEKDKKEETEKNETRKKSDPAVRTKQEGSLDDLWLKHEPGKQALRPGGRSNSLKVQRTISAENAPSVRSATLPKPWSPGQGPSSILTRKLSWELPKVGPSEDAAKGMKNRSEARAEETIQEDSEEQISQTPAASAATQVKTVEKEENKKEPKDEKESAAMSKRPDQVTLEDILSADGDTAL